MLKSGDIGYGMPKSQTAGKSKTGMGGPVSIPSKQPKKPVSATKSIKTPTPKGSKSKVVGKIAKI